MSRVDFVVETTVVPSARVLQLSGSFDAPIGATLRREWHMDVTLDRPWNVGLITGPSGAGKTLCARQLFGDAAVLKRYDWDERAVIDNFDAALSITEITSACSAVGFNTIPSWCKPFAVLSNGEQFRVSVARALLESSSPIVLDEFTSVVDRQVARIAAHAVGKFIRQRQMKFVAVTCHEDVEDWLQPDWVLTPHDGVLRWRSLRRRPTIDAVVAPVPYAAWSAFAPYHYLTAELNRSAQCFAVFINDHPVCFAGLLYRPVSHGATHPIWGISRLVTLPDWQGLGLAMALCDQLGAALLTRGKWLHMYPAHPSLIGSFLRSKQWRMMKKPGRFPPPQSRKTGLVKGKIGGRPNATFRYCGPAAEERVAAAILRGKFEKIVDK